MSTEKKKVTRKLSAILSADVKGYSVLMADDEVHTIETLKAYRNIISDLVSKHSGRVVDSPGDNILAEFRSSFDAVECAVKIQKRLDQENTNFSDDKKVQFRIGVNVGDVIQDGKRIYGNGVNVAARIEGLADAGGVCISRNAYDHIKDKLKLGYEYLGDHEVKNIKDPVRVYKVLMADEDAGKRIGKKKKISKLKWALIAVAALLVIAGGISGTLYWKFFHLPAPTDIDPENKMTFELPKGPSIAVLPFDNMTGDSEQNYFCDGFTEHIISTLSYVPELFVIARNSTFAYKNKPINVQQIGVELNADWIIEGSIQKSDQRIRITVQLIDANTGHHKWSETYDREIEHIFKLQDDIAYEILKAMRIELVDGRSLRNTYEGINSAEEYRKALKAYGLFHEYTIESLKNAEQEMLELIKMNPNIPSAYTFLAFTYSQYIWQGECKSDLICFAKASEAVKSAIRVNDSYDLAYVALGELSMMMGEYEKAENAIKTAMHINPSNSIAYNTFGVILIYQGKFNEAVAQIEKAILLDPLPNWDYYLNLGQAYQYMKNYSKAIDYYNKSIELNPKHWGNYAGLTVSYSRLGKFDKAKKAKSRLLSIRPDFTISQFLKVLPLQNKEAREIITEGFKKSGIPD